MNLRKSASIKSQSSEMPPAKPLQQVPSFTGSIYGDPYDQYDSRYLPLMKLNSLEPFGGMHQFGSGGRISNIPSAFSDVGNKDSLFIFDPVGRTRRSKILTNVMPPKAGKQPSFKQQAYSAAANVALPKDFLEKVLNAKKPQYNLKLLDS